MARKTRLLIVEDEAAIRTGLMDLFVFHGYAVEAAEDGREGLRKALGGGYDLLLLDVMLPGVDGFEICNRVRTQDPEQPIIMLTAKTSDEDIVRGLTLGADDYVAKPFSVTQLVLRVQAVLRRARSVQEDLALIRLSDGLTIDTRSLSGRRGSRVPGLHPPRDRATPIPGGQRRAPGAAGGAAAPGLGLCPRGRHRDPHRGHPCGQAAAQDRTQPGRALPPAHGTRGRLPAPDGLMASPLRGPDWGGFDRRRLRLGLVAFFLALALPSAILVYQAFSRLEWEGFHQQQILAEELAQRLDTRLADLLDAESARGFADYAFLVVEGDPEAGYLQRSPLSVFPPDPEIPGLIGYFQVDAQGGFSSPLLPQGSIDPVAYGLTGAEVAERGAAERHLEQILSSNRLGGSSAHRRPGSGGGQARMNEASARPSAGLVAGSSAGGSLDRQGHKPDSLADADATLDRATWSEEVRRGRCPSLRRPLPNVGRETGDSQPRNRRPVGF